MAAQESFRATLRETFLAFLAGAPVMMLILALDLPLCGKTSGCDSAWGLPVMALALGLTFLIRFGVPTLWQRPRRARTRAGSASVEVPRNARSDRKSRRRRTRAARRMHRARRR